MSVSETDSPVVEARSAGERIVLQVGGVERELTREQAVALQEAIGDAVTDRQEFFRTAGTYREDGSYEVSRRGADSAGNAKVFDSFAACRRLYGRLPETFDADTVGRTGITGSRRHMMVRHFAEHPAFECTIDSRSPLRATKTGTPREDATDAETAETEPADDATDDEDTGAPTDADLAVLSPAD